MENFFYNDEYYRNVYHLAKSLNINKSNVNDLDVYWSIEVELADLEPIFNVDADSLCQLLADANEDRLSEDYVEELRVLIALQESIDFEKLRELLPKLYYPNGKYGYITKDDLVNIL